MILGKSNIIHIGLLAAMPQELGNILQNLKEIEENSFGDLKLYSGILETSSYKKVYISTAWSGWGKVSAARATTRICSAIYKNKRIDNVLFTGVAGGAKKISNNGIL